jgi:hypothetical protein
MYIPFQTGIAIFATVALVNASCNSPAASTGHWALNLYSDTKCEGIEAVFTGQIPPLDSPWGGGCFTRITVPDYLVGKVSSLVFYANAQYAANTYAGGVAFFNGPNCRGSIVGELSTRF